MRITRNQLLDKLHQIDERLLQIWLIEEPAMSEEEVWELFVVLLETRVEIIKSCKEAGIQLGPQECLPNWLESLVNNRQEIRLREIRKMAFELQNRKKISAYDVNSRMFDSPDSSSGEVEP